MNTLKALDLFCGIGGFSWGIKSTGCVQPFWAVDIQSKVLNLYEKNFPDTKILKLDLSESKNIDILVEKVKFYGGVDLIVGGSPCQGFTQIRNGQNTINDPYNQLPIRFAEIIHKLKPQFFIYENVPQFSKFEVFSTFLSELSSREAYQIAIETVDAANFGNPSRRLRLFVVGFRKDLNLIPIISKGLEIPFQKFWWHRTEKKDRTTYTTKLMEPWRSKLFDKKDISLVNTEQALSDLPILEAGTYSGKLVYATPPQSAYQKLARQGVRKTDGHVVPCIHLATRKRLQAIVPGGNWRDLPEALTYQVPGDMTSKKLNRKHYSAYRRLLPEGHSPTVQGHSDFAYHYKYERALTSREMARLMSFPDKFQLGQQYDVVIRAIGNAVPPVLAKGITLTLLNQLAALH